MADTENLIIVDTGGGGNYSTLKAAIDDVNVGYSGNLPSEDVDLRFLLRASTGQHDTGGRCLLDTGFTVDETHRITIEGEYNYRHCGLWPLPFLTYCLEWDGNDAAYGAGGLDIRVDYTTIRDVCVYGPFVKQWQSCFRCEGTDIMFDRCYARMHSDIWPENWGFSVALSDSSYLYKFRNCAAMSDRTYGGWDYGVYVHATIDPAAVLRMHNCTFVVSSAAAIVTRPNAKIIAKNCAFHGADAYEIIHVHFDHLDVYDDAYFDSASTHNAYFHTGEPVTGSNWVDYRAYGMAEWDYTLQPPLDGYLKDLGGSCHVRTEVADGVDLSTDPDLPVTVDIVGNPRPVGQYVIGAHQSILPSEAIYLADRAAMTTGTDREVIVVQADRSATGALDSRDIIDAVSDEAYLIAVSDRAEPEYVSDRGAIVGTADRGVIDAVNSRDSFEAVSDEVRHDG